MQKAIVSALYAFRRRRAEIAQEPEVLKENSFIPATSHPIFLRYPGWSGIVPAGFTHTYAGSLIHNSMLANKDVAAASYVVKQEPPRIEEEIFEWIDLLEAVRDAKDHFVMAEIGAGHGRWSVAAACTIRRFRRDLEVKLTAVEAEPNHFAMMLQHFSENGLDPNKHRLLPHAINASGGEVSFVIGHPKEWYGQAIVPNGFVSQDWPESEVIGVSAITLADALGDEPCYDLVDMDVQGAEAEIIEASIPLINKRVRRLHIGTHGNDIEDRIYASLTDAGWHCVHSFRFHAENQTHYGRVSFVDGIQSWLNPRLYPPI